MAVQCLCSRLGIANGKDWLNCAANATASVQRARMGLAEISIIATDLAEVLGCALASTCCWGFR